MAVLTQLAEPERYHPCDWDLRADAAGRSYWDELFRWHLDAVLAPLIHAEYDETPGRLADFRRAYLAAFDDLRSRPGSFDRVDILFFTELRRRVLEAHGYGDPFRGVKQRENEAALALLPNLLAELDGADPTTRQDLLLHGWLPRSRSAAPGRNAQRATPGAPGRPGTSPARFQATLL